MEALKLVLAAQQVSNTAMLGQIKDLQSRDKVESDPAFNWIMTYAGRDVATYIKEIILGIVTDGEERDLVLQGIEAVNRFLVKSDKDKDRKVLLSSLGLVHLAGSYCCCCTFSSLALSYPVGPCLSDRIVSYLMHVLSYRTRSDPVLSGRIVSDLILWYLSLCHHHVLSHPILSWPIVVFIFVVFC